MIIKTPRGRVQPRLCPVATLMFEEFAKRHENAPRLRERVATSLEKTMKTIDWDATDRKVKNVWSPKDPIVPGIAPGMSIATDWTEEVGYLKLSITWIVSNEGGDPYSALDRRRITLSPDMSGTREMKPKTPTGILRISNMQIPETILNSMPGKPLEDYADIGMLPRGIMIQNAYMMKGSISDSNRLTIRILTKTKTVNSILKMLRK